jgi:hypothetical protein
MTGVEALGPYSGDCLEAFEMLEIDKAATYAIYKAPRGEFTPLGDIKLMGEPVAAGIKKRHVWEAGLRVARELHLADRLLTKFPARSNCLPLFTYAVNYGGNGYAGILTEDFTRNGQRVLHETRNDFGLDRLSPRREEAPEGLHRDVYDALNGRVYKEAFRHMIGFVFDREVMIDFDDVAFPSTSELNAYQELVDTMTVIV